MKKDLSLDLLREVIRQSLSTYGLGRIDPMNGGPGQMFKLGVDYKNASTNIPAVGQGYVDRSHPLPYEITVRTSEDSRDAYKRLFNHDVATDYVEIIPDQVFYGTDGFKMQAHVATATNKADKRDVELIQGELYKYITSLPSTPGDATFIIGVKPVADKIKYFV